MPIPVVVVMLGVLGDQDPPVSKTYQVWYMFLTDISQHIFTQNCS